MSEALPPFLFVGLGGNLGYWQFGALLLGPSRARVPPQPLCPTQSLSWQDLGGFEPPTAIYQAGPRFRRIVCGSGPETSTPEAGKYLKTRLFNRIVSYPRSAWPKSASNGRSGPKRAEWNSSTLRQPQKSKFKKTRYGEENRPGEGLEQREAKMREGRDGPGTQHLEGGLRAPTRRILHLGAGAREGFGNQKSWTNSWRPKALKPGHCGKTRGD